MSSENRKFMRLMVFFDLPVVEKEDRKIYMKFRNFLLKDGYIMLQFSVYSRICNGEDAIEKHLRRLRINLPDQGNIRCLQVTDKQYGNMKLLIGTPRKNEKKINSSQLLLF